MNGLSKWERYAYYIDIYRVWPRAVLAFYGCMSWKAYEWFTSLPDPSAAQSAFPSVVFGVIPLVLTFYCQNGVDWNARRQPPAQPQQPMTATATVTTEKP